MDKLKDNSELLSLIRPKDLSPKVQETIGILIQMAHKSRTQFHLGTRLAALFDLLVSCQYYNRLANKGWTYCPKSPELLLYPYTNACPRCLGHHNFIYTKANKPESGQIGMATTEILCEMLVAYFRTKGRKIDIYKASEPIDVIIYEKATKLMVISEIKAAPLLTIPLSIPCEKITEEVDGNLVNVEHTLCDNPFLHNSQPSLFFPASGNHHETSFKLHINWDIPSPFFTAIEELCESNPKFLPFYFSFWNEAYQAYTIKLKSNPIFWLTNACGAPSPTPISWPKRRSGGYETISDAKSSVGMDRTDDIKKGIYQVLKLGAEYKPRYTNIKTALISNIHAVRHNEEYLQCIKDIIWTIDDTRGIKNWSQVKSSTPLYNLFDGIISFTESDIRDSEIKKIFAF